jgi:hypothetical protein
VTPRRASSCRTDWLSAEVDTPRCLAAATKLRWRATAMKEFRALSGVKATVKGSYRNPPRCATVRAAAAHASYSDFSEAMSMEKRYFTSDLRSLS